MEENLIIIMVVAKAGQRFFSYDLLQAISASGMQFGARNIFHHYSPDKKVLFSLASASESGEFDLNQMGNFSCGGLVLFMDLQKISNAEDTFAQMLSVAEQLADDLKGELRTANRQPWTEAIQQEYEAKVMQYQNV